MIEIRLFGQFSVSLNGQSIAIQSRSAQSLLAYLVLTASTHHRREYLAGLFWPDQPDETARSNLRHALWRLRRALSSASPESSYIISDEISIAFNGRSDYWVDTSILECAASVRANTTDLINLLALYRGELLPGFYDEWVSLERAKLHALFEGEVLRLLNHLIEEQRWNEVLDWAERWIAFGHAPEPAYRALMIGHGKQGNMSKVIAVFQRCVQALHDDLGTEPSAQTRTLYEQLSRAEAESVGPAEASTPDSAASFTSFVGRGLELIRLETSLSDVLAGHGQVIFISGEAGSGKTALVQEFFDRAQAKHANLLVASGICSAYTGIGDPYLPFREALSFLVGDVSASWVGGFMTPENARRLWSFMPFAARTLVEAGPDLIDSFVSGADVLARSTSVTPRHAGWLGQLEAIVEQHTKRGNGASLEQSRVFEQYSKVLLALAAQRPLILVLDDLHWADVSSLGLLFHLGRRISRSRILIIGIYRPDELAHEVVGKSSPLQEMIDEIERTFGDVLIDLDQSTLSNRRDFVDALLDTEPHQLSSAFRRKLFERTEGHALFTTELIRDLRERGVIYRDGGGRWVEARTLDWAALPTRIEATIAHRIGRLSPALQQVLRVASVEGVEFTAEMVAKVQGSNTQDLIHRLSTELDRQHRLIRARDFQYLETQRLSHYQFRHHLFQTYVYQTLDVIERAYLHAIVGNALEELHAGRTEKIAIQLARHFKAAGLGDKAVTYLFQAGEQAAQLSANQEALEHFQQALALLASLPDNSERAQRELALQIALGNTLIAIKGHAAPEVRHAFDHALDLCRQIGDTPDLWRVLSGLYRFYLARGDVDTAHELGDRLVHLSQDRPDVDLVTYAQAALGIVLLFKGEFIRAQTRFEAGMSRYDSNRFTYNLLGEDAGVTCLSYSAWALWFLGYPDQALDRNRLAVTLARDLAHPYTLAHALSLSALFHQFLGKARRAQAQIAEALALSAKHIYPFWSAVNTMMLGWVLVEEERPLAGISQIRHGLSMWQAMNNQVGQSYFLSLLAQAEYAREQIENGLATLDEALCAPSDIGRWWEAELYRLRGEALLQRGSPPAEAEDCFVRALQIAQQQSAKSLELRAAVSLSRLWQAQGKQTMAQMLLHEICHWFTEGFDTADLIEAQALLQQLANA